MVKIGKWNIQKLDIILMSVGIVSLLGLAIGLNYAFSLVRTDPTIEAFGVKYNPYEKGTSWILDSEGLIMIPFHDVDSRTIVAEARGTKLCKESCAHHGSFSIKVYRIAYGESLADLIFSHDYMDPYFTPLCDELQGGYFTHSFIEIENIILQTLDHWFFTSLVVVDGDYNSVTMHQYFAFSGDSGDEEEREIPVDDEDIVDDEGDVIIDVSVLAKEEMKRKAKIALIICSSVIIVCVSIPLTVRVIKRKNN
ncbi:MAG: hypothetical protein GPJ52_14355 [Candidatus Heimdallarchaeota archaeon]|nr:hypothetical protein [Candidatus Heimdallarchaeota archaeon]